MNKNIIIIICLLLIATIVAVKAISDRDTLHANFILTTGCVYDWEYVLKSGGECKLLYVFNDGKRGQYVTGKLDLVKNHRLFINKCFPVIFSPKDTSLNAILITPGDFSAINYSFPDSLNWILEIIQK